MSKKDKLTDRLLKKQLHPSGVLKRYVLDQVIEKLRKDGLL